MKKHYKQTTGDLHELAMDKLGDDYRKLILTERAANQRHWAKKIRKSLYISPLKTVENVEKALGEMEKEAERCEELCQ